MIVFQATLVILFAAILGSALSRKFHLPLELTLLAGSLAVAFIPGVPTVHVDSEVIFFVLLPPFCLRRRTSPHGMNSKRIFGRFHFWLLVS